MNCAYLAGMWRSGLEHQLLWVVMNAMKGIEKDGTRGPTWSWASVDGPVAHGLYSYEVMEPAGITWLSTVDDAQVQPSKNDEFGQIKSGNLTITGRLGVLKINKDDGFQPGSHSVKLTDTAYFSCTFWWDTTEYKQAFGEASLTQVRKYTTYGTTQKSQGQVDRLDIFYLPVRSTHRKGQEDTWTTLSGLLLLPTGEKKGQFRRVGMLELIGYYAQGPIPECTRTTDILDSRFFKRKRGNGYYTVSIV